jgi:hypothetical protein
VIQRIAVLAIVLLLAPFLAPAQDDPPTYLLINNAIVWDGASGTATPSMNVLVECNPLEDVAVLADYDNNIKVVIKDGEIFKNAL